MADDGFRDRVRDATDIAELIGEQVLLRPAGPNRFAGLCPFHKETAPSFQVNTERGFFHCFGCKASGDAFTFLMKRDGVSFVEALHTLARRAGIPIPERNPERASREEALRAANRKALEFFRRALGSSAGRPALDYLRGRGLSAATITEYGLGYAPGGWDELSRWLVGQRVPIAVQVEAGLALEGRRGGHYDFFRNRLMVPILDGSGRAASFAGRSLDGKEPKYVNTKETPVYHKQGVLYGFHHARSAIRRERSAILMEGYFDCLSAWQAGVANAVAVCGTALTPQHAKLLAAQAREVVLAFDSDPGGRRAVRASLPVLLAAQVRVRVARFGDGRDPDDLIRAEGGSALREVVRTAPGFVDFLVEDALEAPSGAGADRAEAAREVLRIIARAPSPLDRESWLVEAAGGLGFSIDAARRELERVSRGPRVGGTGRPVPPEGSGEGASPPPTPRPRPLSAERDLIRWIERRPDEVAEVLRTAEAGDFEGLALEGVLVGMKAVAEAGGDLPTHLAEASAGPGEVQNLLVGARMESVELDFERQTPEDCFRALRIRALRRSLDRLKGKAARGSIEVLRELQAVGAELDALLAGASSAAGRRDRASRAAC